MIELSINLGECLQKIEDYRKAIPEARRSLFAQAASVMLKSVIRNFEVGGRPSWPPLKREKRLPLTTIRAHLKRSISAGYSSESAYVFTNVPYAPVHQFGASSAVLTPKRRKVLRFWGREGKRVFRRIIHRASIPARPFLKFQKEDVSEIVTIFTRLLKR